MEKSQESSLELLKKRYGKIHKKYGLPNFNKMNEDFEIERIHDKETDFLLKEIRRAIVEKITAFLHFFEMFLNPTTAPIFILALLKTLTVHDKKLIEKIYHELVNLELASISLDMICNEKKEVLFVKHTVKKWQKLKPELHKFSEILSRIQIKKKERRSYLG